MKILQINASYKPAYIYGGPTMSVSKLSEVLVANGVSVLVLTTTANGTGELPEVSAKAILVDTVPVFYFKRLTKDHSHFSPGLLLKVWTNSQHFDAVHIHAWWNTVSVLSCLIARLRGVKVIVSPRGTLSNYSFNNKNSFIKKIIHKLLGKPLLKGCIIHTTSNYEEQAMQQLIAPKYLFNIPNFVNFPTEFVAIKKNTGNKLKLIFLSRIEEKKGLDLLINALAKINKPYHLTIAGDGDQNYIDSLKLLADKMRVSANVSWLGFQNHTKFSLLAEHDLLVLPSHDENFGNVVVESLSVGTPALVSKNVGLSTYVTENSLGFSCNPDPDDLAKVINSLDKQTLNDIAQRAPSIIQKDFAESALIGKYTAMYQLET